MLLPIRIFFFRNGIVDFQRLSYQVGRVAEFYARAADTEEMSPLWLEFAKTCGAVSVGRTWKEILVQRPECASKFQDLIDQFYSANPGEPFFYKQPVGVTIPSIPSTAVLIGTGAAQAINGLAQYHRLQSSEFGKDFKLTQSESVRFGYWGRPEDLSAIAKGLNRSDEKSRRFYPIGQELGIWLVIRNERST